MKPSCHLTDARDRLREAALRLFAERGVDEVSVREIAAAAGVTHGLVRHHFAGKDGLVAAVNDHAVARLREVLASVSDDGVDAARSRVSRRRAIEQITTTEPELARYVARRVMEPGTGGHALFAALAGTLAKDLGRLQEGGVLHPDADVEMVSAQLLAIELGGLLIREALESWLGSPAPERWWDSLEQLLDLGLYRHRPDR